MPRGQYDRAKSSREATGRPTIGGGDRPRLYVDPKDLDPRFDYRWCRETTRGEYDEDNIQSCMEVEGFDPVLAEEVPSVAGKRLPGREAKDTLARRGDSILMKRSKEIAQDQKNAQLRANAQQIAGVTQDLSGRMELDGRNFQNLPGAQISEHVERDVSSQRFAE